MSRACSRTIKKEPKDVRPTLPLARGKVTITFQDKRGPTRFRDESFDEQQKAFFHEMTHIYGTDDNTDYIPNEGSVYERVYGDSGDVKEFEGILNQLKGKA